MHSAAAGFELQLSNSYSPVLGTQEEIQVLEKYVSKKGIKQQIMWLQWLKKSINVFKHYVFTMEVKLAHLHSLH